MKIAIVCDWLDTVGGAEKVLQQILKCFPDADIFSLVDFLNPGDRYIIHNKPVTTSFIQKLPFARKRFRVYLPLMPIAIEQFDLSQYDLIISSSHAVAKGVITGPNQLHICYCHSPMRYAWDMQYQYLREANLNSGVRSWIIRYILHKIRIWDSRTGSGVDEFIANSNFIARRIYKIYRRTAHVIYPPVLDITSEYPQLQHSVSTDDNFYVTASRLVPYKKIDLIIEAFTQDPTRRLVVIGDGPEMPKLKTLARGFANIQILGYQDNQVLYEYLARAQAFIFAAEEDFGILPVEAQMLGTPVIAYGKGGALESVIDYKFDPENATGVFFTMQNVSSILSALNEFELIAKNISVDSCRRSARRFREEQFRFSFKNFVLDKYAEFQSKYKP